MRGNRLRQKATGLVVIAACSACSSATKGYYPLDPGRTWRYAIIIHQGVGAAKSIESVGTVVNLSGRTLRGRAVTPQESRQFGQVYLRFLADDKDGIAEIATQSAGEVAPQVKELPNYVLRTPLRVGTEWHSTWQSNQFGAATMILVNKRIEERGQPLDSRAGRFDDCLRVNIHGTGTVNAPNGPTPIKVAGDEWYCTGVGFVQGIFREELAESPLNTMSIDLQLIDRRDH